MAFLKKIVLILTVVYPFLVYWGLSTSHLQLIIPLILILIGLRWLLGNQQEKKILLGTVLSILAIGFFWGEQFSLKFYPVLINLGFLFVFAGSLIVAPTAVEKIARISSKEEPGPHAISYMRKVTWVWSCFFLLNACISTYTAIWGSDEMWVLYNGLIAYLLIGCLFVVEWLVRQRVMRADNGDKDSFI